MEDKKLISYNGALHSHEDLLRVEETSDKTLLIFTNQTVEESVLSIDVLEWELPRDQFIRIHPKHLINKKYSKKIFTIHTDWMELENGEKIPISDKLFKKENKRNGFIYKILKLRK